MIKGPTDNSIGIEVVLKFNVDIGCYLKTIFGRLYLQVSVRRVILVTVKYTSKHYANDSKSVSCLRTNAALTTKSQKLCRRNKTKMIQEHCLTVHP